MRLSEAHQRGVNEIAQAPICGVVNSYLICKQFVDRCLLRYPPNAPPVISGCVCWVYYKQADDFVLPRNAEMAVILFEIRTVGEQLPRVLLEYATITFISI